VPRSVAAAFDALHGQLTPLTTEIMAASSHRASVEAALSNSFSLTRFFQSGSWGNGTSIRRHSDVDYFASLGSEHDRADSGLILARFESVLQTRFPSTSVWVDAPVVRVDFGYDGSERYEIAPAFIQSTDDAGEPIYRIPTPFGGGWMSSSPEGQTAFVKDQHDRLNGKLRPLIRFLKHWKYCNDVPISSYYLELFATYRMTQEATVIYSWDLNTVFDELYTRQLPTLQNPRRVPGTVTACESTYYRPEVMEAVLNASVRAQLAREAEEANKTQDAFYYWRSLFDGHFPPFG
jgi:hypothetical protein